METTKDKPKNKSNYELTVSRNTITTIVIVILAFSVGFVTRGFMSGMTGEVIETSVTPEQPDTIDQIIAEVKKEAKCTCGCGLSLERCEIDDPGCTTRPRIISRVKKLAEEGKTKQEIINSLQEPSQPSRQQVPTEPVEVSPDDDPSIGPSDASVTIIEFSDFQCPFCKRAESTVKQILETYGDEVRFVYRDFPLGFHQNAQKAAEAAECADDQGKFWEYHDLLFENQQSLDTESLKQYASDLNLDRTKFDDCLDSGKYEDEVQEDSKDGQAAGVSGTPTFFINGQKLVGAQQFSAFETIIDSELEK